MLINQIGVEGEPTVVELRAGRPDPASRVTLTDLLGAVWSLGTESEPEAIGSPVTTLVPPGEGADPLDEPRHADVA